MMRGTLRNRSAFPMTETERPNVRMMPQLPNAAGFMRWLAAIADSSATA
jgi:hypothetical protein